MRVNLLSTTVAAALVLLPALPCTAQNAMTVYGGYRGGGSFQESASPNATLSLQGSGSGSLSLDWAIDAARQVQLFASYQPTEIPATNAVPAVPLSVSYLHLGGTNFFDGRIGRGAYVVGGLGLTLMSPGLSGLSSEVRPSMNVGLGYQLPLAPQLALRFELRGYFTLINSNTNLFCSGGCIVSIKGDALTQGEAMLGLSYGF
jgi:hypothetical protein